VTERSKQLAIMLRPQNQVQTANNQPGFQVWQAMVCRTASSRPNQITRKAHEAQSEISSLAFSQVG
jgi:hypothetical protein